MKAKQIRTNESVPHNSVDVENLYNVEYDENENGINVDDLFIPWTNIRWIKKVKGILKNALKFKGKS